jgi:cytochrome P450
MDAPIVARPHNKNAKVTDFNHLDSRPRNDQYALGADFRKNSPIVYSEAHGGVYYVASYDLIKQILMDPENFSNFDGVSEPGHKFDFEVLPSQADPPDHNRFRNALQMFLRPTAIKKHEALVRGIVVDAMQGLLANKGGDVISEFAIHVPLRVTSAVLGYSEAEAHRLHNSFEIMLEGSLELDDEKKKVGMDAFLGIIYDAYERALANEPDDTLVSQLVHQVFEGKRFTREETLGMVSGVTIGAIDTTKHSITNAMYLLAQWPDALRDLLADRSLVPAAVEEVLRLEAVAYFVARTVKHPVTLGGIDLEPGARIVMAYAWANRDETFFPDPEKFDIHRKRNHHFGFGHGVHSCLGMHLARMELRIALEEILDRMPHFELIAPIPNAQSFGSVIYGFEHLNIRILD